MPVGEASTYLLNLEAMLAIKVGRHSRKLWHSVFSSLFKECLIVAVVHCGVGGQPCTWSSGGNRDVQNATSRKVCFFLCISVPSQIITSEWVGERACATVINTTFLSRLYDVFHATLASTPTPPQVC